MKTLLLIALLVASVPIYAQDSKPKKSKLTFVYDKFEDRTNVSTGMKGVKGDAMLFIQGYFNYPGKTQSEPVKQVGLIFYSSSPRWKYLAEGDRQLFVLADGERFAFGDAARDSRVNTGGFGQFSRVTVSERLIFSVDPSRLNRILQAKEVEMKLGREVFKLSGDTVDALRELVSLASVMVTPN